jgi:DNA-binding NtrC family response regulator
MSANKNQLSLGPVLVVEDEYIIAADLAASLEEAGVEVVGPAGSVNEALELIKRDGKRLICAVLDVNVGSQRVYPVADALIALGVPFVFTTGYDVIGIQPEYARAPRLEKPVDKGSLTGWVKKLSEARC